MSDVHDETGDDIPVHEPLNRRAKRPLPSDSPSGYRSTKRGAKAAKSAKKQQTTDKVVAAVDSVGRTTKNLLWLAGWVAMILLGSLVVISIVIFGVNSFARWNAKRLAAHAGSPEGKAERARENLLYIGVGADGRAVGFLASRVDRAGAQAFGVAIPDGAFIEVPGQGFERVGESYAAGPGVSLSAISNFLGVPFNQYAVVSAERYKSAIKDQTLAGLLESASKTNLSPEDKQGYVAAVNKVTTKNTAIVPLPVKPLILGQQTFFEPQRTEVADLIKSWWGVDPKVQGSTTRVVVFNGAGVPGIAGVAAQELIRAGFRVVDTKNADKFSYKKTTIIVQRGPATKGKEIATVLRVGEVVNKPAEQDVADVLVIVGKDYRPPKGGQ